MSKPTAGYWQARGQYVHADGNAIAHAYSDTMGHEGVPVSFEEADANARLFAASKDLLDACLTASLNIALSPTARVELAITLEQLNAAIAKARGAQ